jgi:hypothetical protein
VSPLWPKAPWKRGAAIVAIVAFAAQLTSWLAIGRRTLELRVAETLRGGLRHEIDLAAGKSCRPKHLVLETDPRASPERPEVVALLTSICRDFGVQFHAARPASDLGCSKWLCGDCLGYEQEVRFDTPIVAAAYTAYFRNGTWEYTNGYWYIWCFGRWMQISAGLVVQY